MPEKDKTYKTEILPVLNKQSRYNFGLVIAIPTRGMVDIRFMLHMHDVAMCLPTGLTWKYITCRGERVDIARQLLAEQALKDKARYILFVDDDTFIPLDAVATMMSTGKDVVTGIVWTKRTPSEPCIYKEAGLGPYYDFPKDSLFEVEAAGCACVLIKTEVFKKIKKPWFRLDWKRKEPTGTITAMQGGEDLYFYQKLQNAGIKVYCHSSVLCDHLDIKTGIFYPGSEIVEKYLSKEKLDELKKIYRKIGAKVVKRKDAKVGN